MLRPIGSLGSKIFLSLLIITLLPLDLMAEEVGRFTEVEGQVELYKPKITKPVPVKPQTGVEGNDRIKTEAQSRAQLTFLDASTITVAPLSDITIESYMYDAKKGEQGALAQLTRGLVQLVVPLEKIAKRDFSVKTSTAIMGIRGTELYILIGPEFTDVYVKSGHVAVDSNKESADKQKRSSLPPKALRYVERLAKQAQVRAQRIGGRGIILGPMQASRIRAGQMPTPPVPLTPRHFATLAATLRNGLPSDAVLRASEGPAQLLEAIRDSVPPGPPGGFGTTLPGGGVRGTGGGVASPAQ
jgi:hypothetical protein